MKVNVSHNQGAGCETGCHLVLLSFRLKRRVLSSKLVEVIVGVAKLCLNDKQSLEIVTNPQLFCDTHSAMCLHRILTDKK